MIVRSKTNWWTLLFVWRGSMMKQMLPQLLIVAVLSVVAVWTEGYIFSRKVPLNATPFTLVGVALALFLGFRNSSSYDRWWEGRKLWGALVNTMRSLTRQALTMTGDPGDTRAFRRHAGGLYLRDARSVARRYVCTQCRTSHTRACRRGRPGALQAFHHSEGDG